MSGGFGEEASKFLATEERATTGTRGVKQPARNQPVDCHGTETQELRRFDPVERELVGVV